MIPITDSLKWSDNTGVAALLSTLRVFCLDAVRQMQEVAPTLPLVLGLIPPRWNLFLSQPNALTIQQDLGAVASSPASFARVFIDQTNKRVHKFYDVIARPWEKPHFEFLRQHSLLPGLEKKDLAEDITRLSYTFIKSVLPRTGAQFGSVLATLQLLHTAGMVHNDVRESNLVFK